MDPVMDHKDEFDSSERTTLSFVEDLLPTTFFVRTFSGDPRIL